MAKLLDLSWDCCEFLIPLTICSHEATQIFASVAAMMKLTDSANSLGFTGEASVD